VDVLSSCSLNNNSFGRETFDRFATLLTTNTTLTTLE
jgi:hypothetical protein